MSERWLESDSIDARELDNVTSGEEGHRRGRSLGLLLRDCRSRGWRHWEGTGDYRVARVRIPTRKWRERIWALSRC